MLRYVINQRLDMYDFRENLDVSNKSQSSLTELLNPMIEVERERANIPETPFKTHYCNFPDSSVLVSDHFLYGKARYSPIAIFIDNYKKPLVIATGLIHISLPSILQDESLKKIIGEYPTSIEKYYCGYGNYDLKKHKLNLIKDSCSSIGKNSFDNCFFALVEKRGFSKYVDSVKADNDMVCDLLNAGAIKLH